MFKTDDGEQISVDDYQKLMKENNRLKLKLEILKKSYRILRREIRHNHKLYIFT